MIIDFQVSSKDYNKKISKNYKNFDYTCPKCGAKKKYHRHGTYFRHITGLSVDGCIFFEPIEILRLKCVSCSSTHAILPQDIIPFQVYTLITVVFLCKEIFIHKKSLRKTAEKKACSVQTIYQKLNLLKRNLVLIEFYLRQVSLYTSSSSLSPFQALEFLQLPTMKFYSYFHCHGQPLFLNRQNTISYRFYFTAAFS